MSTETVVETTPKMSKADKRLLAGTMIGTAVEWYDFFIYANAVALVFAAMFFQPAGTSGPVAQIIAFLSIGVSFLVRPLGAIIAGHLGDRIGRKKVLVLTLSVMGIATFCMGLLPTYAQIGLTAPILLILLRILQGLSTGGEWGAAAIMAVEHAPAKRRGLYGSFPQIGAAIGMLLATGIWTILAATLNDDQFNSWGWRVPFWFSLVLVAVGFWIRRQVEESPVFEEAARNTELVKMPAIEVFKTSPKQVWQAIWLQAGVNAAGYMLLGGFILNYATSALAMDRTVVLSMILLVCVVWIFTTLWAGVLSDKIGRVKTYKFGFIWMIVSMLPVFLLIDMGQTWALALALLIFIVGVSFAYGQQAATTVEMFPSRVRFSGVAISHGIGSIVGGGFAPTIAAGLVNGTGWIGSVAIYLAVWAAIALVVIWGMKDRTGQPLDFDVTKK